MPHTLTRSKNLWMLFVLTLTLTLAFGVVMKIWDFQIIDEMYHAEQIRAHIEAMTPLQRRVHTWMTATLDVAYPLVYGGLFIGIILKAFTKFGRWLVLPAIFVMPVDLVEGVSQVLLLNGYDGAMEIKLVATPLKLLLFVAALVISLVGVGVMWRRKRA